MLMSTDVASILLPVTRGIMMMDRERDIDTTTTTGTTATGSPIALAGAAAAAVRGMKRVDPAAAAEADVQTTATAAALVDLAAAECKRPRIDGTGGDVGQVRGHGMDTHTRGGVFVYRYSGVFQPEVYTTGGGGGGVFLSIHKHKEHISAANDFLWRKKSPE